MTETLEEIAIRIAEDIPEFLWTEGCAFESGIVEAQIIDFSKRLVKELGAQDHVAYMIEHNGKVMGFVSTPEKWTIPVYKAPRI